MTRNRFSNPETTRIEISDGDWLVVKTSLDAGDQRKMDSLAVVPTRLPDGRVVDRIDWSMYEFLRTDLWLVDWSLTKPNAEGKVAAVPKTVDSLRHLETEDFDEINNTVYDHIIRWVTAKKAKRGTERPPSAELNASPISQS